MADDPDDDYVANLLKEDARKAAQAYSTAGISAYQGRRPATAQLKPNKRFLRNLLRETDSHNKAQLAKEASESRAKLRALERGEQSQRSRRGRSRSPILTDDERDTKRRTRSYRHDHERDRSPERKRKRSRSRGRSSRSKPSRSNRSTSPSRTYKQAHRTRSPSASDHDHDRGHRRHRTYKHTSKHYSSDSDTPPRRSIRKTKHRYSNRTRSRSRSRSPRLPQKLTSQSQPQSTHPPQPKPSSSSPSPGPGPQPQPAPPIRIRGRGQSKYASPANKPLLSDIGTDIEHMENNNSSDTSTHQSLRQWNKLGAQRLRAAGFTDEQVKKWETSDSRGKEKSEEDVRWTKRGESREWDRGKRVDGSGNVHVRDAGWGSSEGRRL